ncbi:MAG: succinylglutamate desuccinylase/aspartoacylase family protein [Proteobacteria bacterium]|nr:succinylglutamate desuccinylase/aspartoacylase family protein [Pseudomonadota bacterium]
MFRSGCGATLNNEGKQVVAPGEKKKFTYLGERTFEGAFVDFAVFAARGVKPGPTLRVTSAIHGDEVNSVEIARRVFAGVDAQALAGTLIVLPAVNSSGFRTANRYLPDRRDLNRSFPGSANGSLASILAKAEFSGVIRDCTHLIDLHTGSNLRTNYPQIRVDIEHPGALDMARSFGVGIIVPGGGPQGSLRREALDAGVVSIIYEAGPPYIFVEDEIERGTYGVRNVMIHLGMVVSKVQPEQSKILGKSHWIRVPRGQGGIYIPLVKLGDVVTEGQLLGTVTDPVTDQANEIRATDAGLVVGMALSQVVLSGYGLFHVGEVK